MSTRPEGFLDLYKILLFPITSEETIDVDVWEDNEEPEYIGVVPQDGNEYTLVVDNDVDNYDNDVVEAEEV